MSSYESSPSSSGKAKRKGKGKGRASRPAISASRIAKDPKKFETWKAHQGLVDAASDEIPDDFKNDISHIFDRDVRKRLPLGWVKKDSEAYKSLNTFASAEFVDFVAQAHKEDPSLFYDEDRDRLPELVDLYADLKTVFNAWDRLSFMNNSGRKWSEADYSNVYAMFRTPALQNSAQRVQCAVCLPQPLSHNMSTDAADILKTMKIVPDCVILVPEKSITQLSASTDSTFTRLSNRKAVMKTGSPSKRSSFRYQATVCESMPETPGFEFASSIWEDKKPMHDMLQHAYQQNRMSTTSAVRHLYAMHVNAPVIGLVWSRGMVRVHIDWCRESTAEAPVVYSALYPRTGNEEMYEWRLDRASDILQMHFIINNIDRWTTDGFLTRVLDGVAALRKSILKDRKPFKPWRRCGDIVPRSPASQKENTDLSAHSAASPPSHKKSESQRI